MNEKRAWLWESIRYFRGLDFFGEYSGSDAEEILRSVDSRRRTILTHNGFPAEEIQSLEDSISLDGEAPDLSLLQWDINRVWHEDMEQDLCPGDNAFRRILKEWSRISRGTFLPAEIEEVWPNNSPMYVQFLLNGRMERITPWINMPTTPREGYGLIDMDMLNRINAMIDDSGYYYAVYDLPYQDVFVVVLNDTEYERLERERGWKFA